MTVAFVSAPGGHATSKEAGLSIATTRGANGAGIIEKLKYDTSGADRCPAVAIISGWVQALGVLFVGRL
jgi:hypothetical protein